jgi:nitroreductase
LVLKARSYRRFYQDVAIKKDTIKQMIDFGRLAGSGGNLQPLKYKIVNDAKTNALIFPFLKWAGYLTKWPGPEEGERPPAYIIVLNDTKIAKSAGCDHGLAIQNIVLAAAEMDLGCCILGSIDRDGIRKKLKIQKRYEILLVMAVGKPKEKVTIDKVDSSGKIKYWRDINNIHHVPKRSLKEVIVP